MADRISINVELPTPGDLQKLAPEKNLTRIRQSMSVIKGRIDQSKAERRESVKAPVFAPAGQSTQMIIGATPATDTRCSRRPLRSTASNGCGASITPPLARSRRLEQAPARRPAACPRARLYQADWLMRFYGFDVSELTTAGAPNLDLTIDPKLAWALRHPEKFPVDLNKAARELLLRVPGLGVKNVDRIVRIRRWHQLTLADLTRLRVPLKKPCLSSSLPITRRICFHWRARCRRSGTSNWNSSRPEALMRQITFAPTFLRVAAGSARSVGERRGTGEITGRNSQPISRRSRFLRKRKGPRQRRAPRSSASQKAFPRWPAASRATVIRGDGRCFTACSGG
jgi:hypothetical protein